MHKNGANEKAKPSLVRKGRDRYEGSEIAQNVHHVTAHPPDIARQIHLGTGEDISLSGHIMAESPCQEPHCRGLAG